MPATFAHCLIARQAIDDLIQKKEGHPYAGKVAMYNHFVTTGSTGPDYPYLTDIISYGLLHLGHNWANRMHYENTDIFVKKGTSRLSTMNKESDEFFICLSWFCGYVSHVIADSFIHPLVNSAVGGTYLFTKDDHAKCELVQDIYIFKEKTKEEIVHANPRSGTFAYLNILEECSDLNDVNRIHPAVRKFWTDLLKEAHPQAKDYFGSINPDEWHSNYMPRVDFITNPGPIFRHVVGGMAYKTTEKLTQEEKNSYIEQVPLPNGKNDHYLNVFNRAVEEVTRVWGNLFRDIEGSTTVNIDKDIKDWDLDTGVDQNIISYWV